MPTFDQVRSQIKTGDLISVRGEHGLFSRLTRFFTRSEYTHNSIAIWINGLLFVAELNGGRNHLTLFAQLKNLNFDVSHSLVENEQAMYLSIIHNLSAPIDYGIAALPVIGAFNFLGIKYFVHWRKILVCSGFCIKIYEDAGYPETTRILSPVNLFKLSRLKFQVRIK